MPTMPAPITITDRGRCGWFSGVMAAAAGGVDTRQG
jgi:hypothetical protein